MDGPEFDAWTRRRIGLAAGGALAALAGTQGSGAKKKRKKRCRKLGAGCQPDGKRKCCGQLRCRTTAANTGVHTFCCKTEGKSCDPEGSPFQCCGDLFCCETSGTCAFTCVS